MDSIKPETQRAMAQDVRHKADVLKVTWVGLAANLLLSGFKLVAGLAGHSQAVVADAVHSLSDLTTDLAVLIGIRYWSAPADLTHPYGHARIETVVTALIGSALALVAVGIGYDALVTLQEVHDRTPSLVAFVAAAVSIVSKEALYRWTVAVGRRAKSSAVVANAWHHRSDALSSIPAAAVVAVAIFLPSWSFIDHVGAIIVSLLILQAAWKIAAPAAGELMDRGAPARDRDHIEQIALATDGVRAVHAIRTRYVGSALQVDLHIEVEGDMTVRDGHRISMNVKRRVIAEGPDVADVVVHLEPYRAGATEGG